MGDSGIFVEGWIGVRCVFGGRGFRCVHWTRRGEAEAGVARGRVGFLWVKGLARLKQVGCDSEQSEKRKLVLLFSLS